MKNGLYVSKCGTCICLLEDDGDGVSLSWTSTGNDDFWPMNKTKLRRFFRYLGEF